MKRFTVFGGDNLGMFVGFAKRDIASPIGKEWAG
jgi:hypothetical protein